MRRQARNRDDQRHRFAALRLARGALLGTTAIQAGFALGFALPSAALLAPTPAAAQPAADARPVGGTVVAGQASIARQPDTTRITQSSDRAAINWQSFDIGRDQRVVFQQPGAGSMTLNRVTGPNPSEIAGRIQANGGVVVINGAGVVFHRGAQVEAGSFIASTADTTNAAFMAGRLQFDRPGRPGARIENRGDITVRETGLAALVAPGVANSGTIRARLGTVVLAGAETHTIDLHGDGLVAFDVTGQVRTAPAGGPAQALVTNAGTIVAEGGNVLLTARAADGVVQQLVSAGGSIRADSVGPRTGRIEISGVGGGIRVHGTVAAEGTRPGERGGTVVVNGPGEVTLGDTARVVASGQAGGGTVALGTTAARARAQGGGVPAGSARRVTVARGARVEADATARGDGGRVAILSTERTAHAGAISARGGRNGGDGGRVEVSGERGFSLTGSVDTIAPLGTDGTLLIDPRDLSIVASSAAEIGTNPAAPQVAAGDGGAGADAELTVATLLTLLGSNSVRLEATQDLFVKAAIAFSSKSNSLTLAAGRHVTVDAPIALKGGVSLLASDTAIAGRTETGFVTLNAPVTSTDGAVLLRSFGTSGGIAFGAAGAAAAATTLGLVADTMTLPAAAGALAGQTVEIAPNGAIGVSLGVGAASGLALPSLASVGAGQTIRLGAAALAGGAPTTLADSVTLAGDLALSGVALDLRATNAVGQTGGVLSGVTRLTGAAGTGFILALARHGIAELGGIATTAGALSVKTGGALDIVGTLSGNGGIVVDSAGLLRVNSAIASAGDVTLTGVRVEVRQPVSGAVVSLTGTTATAGETGVELKAGVTGTARISIAADAFVRNANAITAIGGAVEIAPHNAGTAQAVTDFGGITTGTLRFGAVTRPGAATPTTTAATLELGAGTPAGIATLDLRAAGAVSQAVTLDLTGITLTGRAGSFSLDDAANKIGTLGALTATAGGLTVTSGTALAVGGAVSAVDDVALRSAGTLTIAAAGGSVAADAVALKAGAGGIAIGGAVTAASTLALTTTGAVSGNGAVSATTLNGSVGSLALGGTTAAAISTIGNLTSSGGFDLKAAGPLTVGGTLAAAQGVNGDVSIALGSGTLSVTGSVATGTPGGTTGGAIALSGPGGVTLGGTVVARSAAGSTGNVTATASSGAVTQTGGSVTAAAALALNAGSGASQTGGTLDAATLTATLTEAGASLALTGANRFDTIGAVTAPGSIAIGNAIALSVAGPVRGGQAPVGAPAPGTPTEVRITAAGAMAVSGEVTAGQAGGGGAPAVAGLVVLQSTDGALRGGAASPAGIDIAPSATVVANRVGGAGGEVAMTAESATPGAGIVTVRAPLSVPAGGAFAITANGVVVGGGVGGIGALNAPLGRIAINADAITLEGAPLLNLTGGTVALAPRASGVAISLGGAGAGLVLDNATLARIGADVLEIGRADGGDIALTASITIAATPALRLLGAGNLSANPGAVLTVGRLEGTIGGTIALDQPGAPHAVGTLGDLSAGGTLAFRAAAALSVAGAVTGGPLVALAAGPLATLGIAGGGSVTAGAGGVLRLQADLVSLAGPVAAAGGTVEILPVTGGRAITLGGAGGLSLLQADVDQITAATLLLGAADGGATMGGNLSVAGLVDFTGAVDRLRLRVTGDIADPDPGTPRGIRVDRLGDAVPSAGVNAASLSLVSADNRIGRLDGFATTGSLSLVSAIPLTVAGPVAAGGSLSITGSAADPVALAVTGSVQAGTIAGIASGFGGNLVLLASQGGLSVGSAATVAAREGGGFGGGVQFLGGQSGSGLTSVAGSVVADGAILVSAGDGATIGGSLTAIGDVTVDATSAAPDPALVLTGTGALASTAGDVRIIANRLVTLDGAVTATAGELVLDAAAVAGTGAVQVGAVAGSAASLALTGGANRIGMLGPLTITGTGGITLADLDPLSVVGLSSAGPVTLSAPTLDIPLGAVLSAPGQAIALTAANGITADGQMIGASLAGSAGTGSASFANAANAVDSLGDFSAGMTFLYRGATALTVAGDIVAPGGIEVASTALALAGSATAAAGGVTLTATAGTLSLAGDATARDGAVLGATGDIAQSAGTVQGALVQATAGGAVTQAAGATLRATGTDVVVTGAGFGLAGTLDAARDVLVTATSGDGSFSGTVTAATGMVSLASTFGTLLLSGDVTAAGSVLMNAGGGIGQSAGTVQGALVQATAAGAVTQASGATLRATGTDVAVTGASFDLAGTLDAARDAALTATSGTGSVGGNFVAGQNISLTVSGGVLSLPGTLDAGRDIIALASDGIGQTGTLAGASGVLLTATGGDISVAGTVNSAGGTIGLSAPAGRLLLGGDVDALNLVSLTAGGDIVQSAGSVTGESVIATAGGSFTQTGGTLRSTGSAPFGNVTVDAASFDISGTIDASRDVAVTALSGTGGLGGSVTAGGNVSASAAAGQLTVSGTIVAGLDADFAGATGLTHSGSVVAAGALTAAATGGPLSMLGTTQAQQIALQAGSDVVVSGTVEGLTYVFLTAGGAILGTGIVETPVLRVSSAGDTALTGANRVAELYESTAGGNLTLNNARSLAVLAPVAAGGTIVLDVSGALTLASGSMAAALAAPVVVLNATSITQIEGTIQTSALNASATGAIALGLANNRITGLAAAAGTDLNLVTETNLALTGPVSAGGALGLTAAGPLAVPGGTSATAGTTLALTGTQLDLSGTVAAPSLALTATAGDIAQDAGSIGWTGTATLNAANAIRQTGGALLGGPAALLTGNAGGAISLTAAGNIVPRLGPLSAGNGLAIATLGDLAVIGALSAGTGALDLAAGGALNLAGVPIAGASATLTAGGTLVQGVGASLTVGGPLRMAVGGSASLLGTVTADTASLSVGGDVALEASSTVGIAGALDLIAGGNTVQQAGARLSAGGPLRMAVGGSASLGGSVTADTASLRAAGNLTQATGGSVTVAGALDVASTGGSVTLDGSVAAGSATLAAGQGVMQAAGGSLASTGALAIDAGTDIALNGVVSGDPVRLTAGRAISQAASGALATGTLFLSAGTDATLAGTLAAGLVTGTAGGAMLLDGPATRIGLLQDIAAGTRLVVRNDAALQVEGRIAAPSVIIRADGPLRIGTVTLSTGGVPFAEPPPGPVGLPRLPEPVPGTPGAVFETLAGTLDVAALTVTPAGAENATLALRLPAAGGALTIGTLVAPATDVTFDLGAGGRASGRIDVRNLTILGGGGATDLQGSVRGFNGQAAASVAAIGPQLQPEYQINNCPVGSVSCVLLIVQIPVITDPLRELGVVTTRDDRDDPDIFIPNVAERDF